MRSLVKLAVQAEKALPKHLSLEVVVDQITEILISRREMLEEYFAIEIDAEGRIQALPLLLRDYIPNLDKLPLFLMRLGPQVRDSNSSEPIKGP